MNKKKQGGGWGQAALHGPVPKEGARPTEPVHAPAEKRGAAAARHVHHEHGAQGPRLGERLGRRHGRGPGRRHHAAHGAALPHEEEGRGLGWAVAGVVLHHHQAALARREVVGQRHVPGAGEELGQVHLGALPPPGGKKKQEGPPGGGVLQRLRRANGVLVAPRRPHLRVHAQVLEGARCADPVKVIAPRSPIGPRVEQLSRNELHRAINAGNTRRKSKWRGHW